MFDYLLIHNKPHIIGLIQYQNVMGTSVQISENLTQGKPFELGKPAGSLPDFVFEMFRFAYTHSLGFSPNNSYE